MAFDQELAMLEGRGVANLSDPYAWASFGGVPDREKQLEDAVQSALDKRREEMLKEVGGESTDTEFANDLFALEKKLQIQYSNMTSDSNVTTVDELKKEISSLFPEYTFTTSKPKDVTQGKNLLYIDETNLNKMLKDSSYKSQVYALMGRELAGNNGFHVYGSAWKITGTTFTLSEDNPKEGGIPYAGMSSSVRLDDSYTFTGESSKVSIFSMIEKVQTTKESSKKENTKKEEKADKKDSTSQSKTEEIWEKERMKYADYMERLEQEQLENKEQINKLNKEAIAKKYEDSLRYQ